MNVQSMHVYILDGLSVQAACDLCFDVVLCMKNNAHNCYCQLFNYLQSEDGTFSLRTKTAKPKIKPAAVKKIDPPETSCNKNVFSNCTDKIVPTDIIAVSRIINSNTVAFNILISSKIINWFASFLLLYFSVRLLSWNMMRINVENFLFFYNAGKKSRISPSSVAEEAIRTGVESGVKKFFVDSVIGEFRHKVFIFFR